MLSFQNSHFIQILIFLASIQICLKYSFNFVRNHFILQFKFDSLHFEFSCIKFNNSNLNIIADHINIFNQLPFFFFFNFIILLYFNNIYLLKYNFINKYYIF